MLCVNRKGIFFKDNGNKPAIEMAMICFHWLGKTVVRWMYLANTCHSNDTPYFTSRFMIDRCKGCFFNDASRRNNPCSVTLPRNFPETFFGLFDVCHIPSCTHTNNTSANKAKFCSGLFVQQPWGDLFLSYNSVSITKKQQKHPQINGLMKSYQLIRVNFQVRG